MNKQLYRIIFNQSRQMWMVVAEIARAGRGRTGRRYRCPSSPQHRCRLTALRFGLLLAFGGISLTAQAAIVADGQAPGRQQPTIIRSANGTPQVNIQTPGADGVSHNTYRQFDVDKQGVILNNSHQATQTQLGGMVAGNPWLAKGDASVILNEVNSRYPSQLNGWIEVAGHKAEVIIANPAGITCNGCGFINSHRTTLTTGQALMERGRLKGFDVNQGEVRIDGHGMDSTQQSYTDIIARSVAINAKLHAQDLKVTTGRNIVDTAHQQIEKKSIDDEKHPAFALDVAALGGMYAHKIRLIGTETGVGVHNAGNIGASAGEVHITADGWVENRGTLSSRDTLQLTSSADVTNTGKLLSQSAVNLQTKGALRNQGRVEARGDTTVNAGTIHSSHDSVWAAGLDDNGNTTRPGSLTLTAQHVQAKGKNLAADTLAVHSQRIDLSDSQTAASQIQLTASQAGISTARATVNADRLTAKTPGQFNNDGGQLVAKEIHLTTPDLSNQQGKINQTGTGELTLHTRTLNNREGTVFNQGKLTLTTDRLNNRQGTIASQGEDLHLTAHQADNNQGTVQLAGQGRLSLNTQRWLGDKGKLLTNGALTIQAGELQLNQAETQAGQITVNADTLSHQGGVMQQQGKDTLSLTTRKLDNQRGTLAGNGNLNLKATTVDNRHGNIVAAEKGSLTLAVKDTLDNQSGRVLSGGQLTLRTGDVDNTGGIIAADGKTTLTSAELTNTQGQIAGNGGLDIHSQQLINREGTLQSADALTLDTDGQLLDNQQGHILGEGKTTITSGPLDNRHGHLQGGQLAIDTRHAALDNRDGKLLSTDTLTLNTHQLDNRHGQVQAVGDTTLNVDTQTDNTGGLIRGGQQLTLNTAHLINRETKQTDNGLEAQNLTVNAQQVDNTQGALRAANHLKANISQTLNNTQGLVSAGKQLILKSEARQPHLAINNRQGTLIAGEHATINAHALSGDGQLLSQGDMAVTLTEDFHHTGNTAANGNLTLKTTGNLLNDRQIKAGRALHLDTHNLTNSASGEISAGQTQIQAHDTLSNTGLIDGGLTHLTANTLNNTGTGRIYGDQLALQTGTLNNTAQDGKAAVIAARDRLDIGTATLNNQHHAQIYSVGDMRIGGQLDNTLTASGQAHELNNHAATIEAGRHLKINADQINNTNAGLVTQVVETEKSQHHDAVLSGQTTRYDWSQVDTSHRNKYKVHDAIMPDGSRSNDFYEYQYTRTVKETQVKQSDPGKILAGGNITLNSAQVTNHDSQIVASGALDGEIGELHNIATQGERITTDKGRQTHWYAKKTKHKKFGFGGTKTSQGKSRSNYDPAPVIETIDLKTLAWQENTRPQGTDITITDRQTGQIHSAPTAVTPVNGIKNQPLVLPPETVKGQTVDPVIRVVTPDTRLPNNSLYTVQPGSDSHYLVETDPKFTQYKQWLGSDYMRQQLTHDPALVHKRLGDGFYEQRLVRDQITQLTGQRYLPGYNNDEAQFKALMDAGVAFGKQQQLTPGVALSPAQMALLTSDIIWLTNQTVTLPDGTTEVVTVPQVYARVRQGDLSSDGALLAGNTVALNSQGDITNSGTMSGRDVTQLTANNLTNSGFIRGGKVDLAAQQTLTNRGGQIQGDDRVTLKGRDITSASTVRGDEANRWLDRPAGIYVQNDKGTLSLSAINNVQLTASDVKNAGKDGHTEITAGHNLTLDALSTRRTEQGDWGKDNTRRLTQQQDIGSQITGAGEVTLQAGQDLNATAAHVNAGQQLTAQAGNNLTLTTGTASSDLVEHSKQTSKGWLSKSSVETHDEVHDRQALSTTFSGDKVTLQAGKDLNIRGSNVAGTQDVSLNAGHQLTVTTAAEAHDETHLRQEKKSGLMGTSGMGFTVGKASQKVTTDSDSQLSKGSTVGSSQGNVTLNAGEQLRVHGSEVIAGKDLTLTGQQVDITSAENRHHTTTKTEQKQSGLTVALSGAAGGAVNSAVQTARAARTESDPRVKALQNTKAALSGVQAAQAGRLAEAQGSDDKGNNNLAGVSLSYGRQSSRSEQQHRQTTQQGSHLTAGDNLTITAKGDGKGASGQNGDIRIQGSQLQAGKDLQLNANRDIQLSSSQNTEQTTGKNSSHGRSLGMGLTVGPGGTGLNVSANVSRGNGRENGNGVSHTNTTLQAGQSVGLNSGRDTTLKGAQVSGEQITADVKRHLILSSEQDSQRYDSQQQNASAGVSATVGPLTNGTASLNASRNKLHSNYDSVQEQTGLFAGKGGYQVNVGDHTQLDGAVIASHADKTKNTLNTGTLGFKDIKNQADFTVEQQSAGVSLGQPTAGQVLNNLAVNGLSGSNNQGHDSTTTHAAVSDGNLIIRDKAHQTQDVANLSRDTDNAANVLSPIFDKEKEQQRLKQAQLIGELSAQMTEIARTEGKIIATKAAKAKLDHISEPDKAAARKKLVDSGNPHPTAADINKQVYDTAYTQALNDSGFGTGGTYQKALQAATAAIQGLAGNNLGQALAGGASPYLAGVIKALTTDPQTHKVDIATNTLAHAILGAVTAEVSGNNALSGAAGAASGELAAQVLIKQLYGDGTKVSELTEEQKQTISTLSTLAAGLAGGIAGDSTASALTGAQAGKNAIENNYLSVNELDSFAHQARTCEGESCKQVIKDMVDTNIRNQQEMMDFCNSNPTQCAQKYGYLVDQWPVFERTLKNMDRDGTLPVEFRNYLSAVNTLGQAATGKVGELGWTKRFEAMGMSQETAAAMAMTLPIVMEGAKGPKSSPKSSQNNAGKDAQPELAGKNTSGAENAATYPKLKEDLVQRNLSHIASQDPRLAAVVKGDNGKLNYGIGTGTRTEADRLGKIWVGDGAKKTTGNGWVSADGTRGYRPPSEKPNSAHATTGVQANFETYSIDSKGKINKTGNGHLNILD
ncbi:filamentous hemagglutinin N-terminal domain-containing protein [Photorhabdus laumondii subsp. laumondii]|uniref:two-partner secretion domain-containing protein n=1 Tax=Photorhabdus laumondii TaxID=2218628 RepID=UPI0013899A18|nr:hemagglutinin repeat-containing protein [Photorhabdus laumondii]NDL32009.1 filamentous hemagglutinin N-terminal domain-containing protein [Photorhabdus laumondii subsp. laumondii]